MKPASTVFGTQTANNTTAGTWFTVPFRCVLEEVELCGATIAAGVGGLNQVQLTLIDVSSGKTVGSGAAGTFGSEYESKVLADLQFYDAANIVVHPRRELFPNQTVWLYVKSSGAWTVNGSALLVIFQI